MQLQSANRESDNHTSPKIVPKSETQEDILELSAGSDKYPGPSTPQIKQGKRLPNSGHCQDQTYTLTDKESMEHDGDSKSVENTFGDSVAEATVQMSPPREISEADIREEDEIANGCMEKSNVSSGSLNEGNPSLCCDSKKHNKASRIRSCSKASRKKMKVSPCFALV